MLGSWQTASPVEKPKREAISHCGLKQVPAGTEIALSQRGWLKRTARPNLPCLTGASNLSHRGVCDVAKTKRIMGNIGVLLRGGDLLSAREERGGARLQFLEFNGSHSLISAQLCNIAGKRSQEKPSQV
jgi:hypothetical protein